MTLFIQTKRLPLRILIGAVSLGYPFFVYLYGKDFPTFSDIALYYPVAINLIIAGVFGLSLIYPPSLIEKIARQSEPDLNENGVKYTRVVTKIWFGFCLLNSLISLFTVVQADIHLWTLYNGCVSYILIGSLITGEYIFRRHYKRRNVD